MGKDDLLQAYRDMLLIRRFEEKAGQLYGMGLIGGFCHLYIGQEAVVVGMQAALQRGRPGHHRLSRPRPHAGRGMDPKGVMAELTGRAARLFAAARAARCTCSASEKKFYGGHGIVGAQVPLGTGLAFANRYRGNDGVCLTYFGDGAANQGQVYESFNMAELWKLPVVYVIENNQYAMGTSRSSASSAQTDLSKRGASFNIPGVQVDGMDVRAVQGGRRRGRRAWCRAGKGPYHPGDEDLPLSRPLDVRPGQVPHPRGSRRRCATSATRSSMRASAAGGAWASSEDELKAIDDEVKRDRQRRRRIRPARARSRIRPSSTPTCCVEALS